MGNITLTLEFGETVLDIKSSLSLALKRIGRHGTHLLNLSVNNQIMRHSETHKFWLFVKIKSGRKKIFQIYIVVFTQSM